MRTPLVYPITDDLGGYIPLNTCTSAETSILIFFPNSDLCSIQSNLC